VRIIKGNRYRLKSKEWLNREYGDSVPETFLPIPQSVKRLVREKEEMCNQLAGQIVTVTEVKDYDLLMVRVLGIEDRIFQIPEDAILSGVE
jgi:hypothetical protein